jgi:hypothetical protein
MLFLKRLLRVRFLVQIVTFEKELPKFLLSGLS